MSQQSKAVTSASAWRKAAQLGPTPLELPSGNVCLVKVPGPQAFLTQGLVPNMLLPIIQGVIERAQKGQETMGEQEEEKILADLMDDPEKLAQVFEMADAVCVYCVIDPPVQPVPADDRERDPEILYVDEVDAEDKFFIMQVAMGGSKDLERFRDEPVADVDGVPAGKRVAGATQRTPRSRSR